MKALAVPDEHLADWYSIDGLSTREIAERIGVVHPTVVRHLRAIGIEVSPRGVARDRPRRRRRDRTGLKRLLEELYVDRHLSSGAIAEMLHASDRYIRERLAEFDIPRRTRGWANREDRRVVPAALLENLYVAKELPADEVGQQVGRSRREILRAAHDADLPVRPGGTDVPWTKAIRLLTALYGDRTIRKVLRQHAVPIVRVPGAIHERFPRPVDVTDDLLRELYCECGLGIYQIELLTGCPTGTLLHRMERARIERRAPGGLSPFLRRQRQLEKS